MRRAEAAAAGSDLEYEPAKAALEARLPSGDDEDDDTAESAWSALEEAERVIFEVVPTTHAGAAALPAFTADELENETQLVVMSARTIRNVVKVLERGAQS